MTSLISSRNIDKRMQTYTNDIEDKETDIWEGLFPCGHNTTLVTRQFYAFVSGCRKNEEAYNQGKYQFSHNLFYHKLLSNIRKTGLFKFL